MGNLSIRYSSDQDSPRLPHQKNLSRKTVAAVVASLAQTLRLQKFLSKTTLVWFSH